jgi:hypothetical protein
MKYLYYITKYKNSVYREQVQRETANFYIMGNGKISKKTMRTGSGWDVVHYYEETAELLKRCKETEAKAKFLRWLEKASKINDIAIMKNLMAIDIETKEN